MPDRTTIDGALQHYVSLQRTAAHGTTPFVSLMRYGITELTPHILFTLAHVDGMKSLSLRENLLVQLPSDLSMWRGLESLDLSANLFPSATAVIVGLCSLPALRHLRIDLPTDADDDLLVAHLPALITFNGLHLSAVGTKRGCSSAPSCAVANPLPPGSVPPAPPVNPGSQSRDAELAGWALAEVASAFPHCTVAPLPAGMAAASDGPGHAAFAEYYRVLHMCTELLGEASTGAPDTENTRKKSYPREPPLPSNGRAILDRLVDQWCHEVPQQPDLLRQAAAQLRTERRCLDFLTALLRTGNSAAADSTPTSTKMKQTSAPGSAAANTAPSRSAVQLAVDALQQSLQRRAETLLSAAMNDKSEKLELMRRDLHAAYQRLERSADAEGNVRAYNAEPPHRSDSELDPMAVEERTTKSLMELYELVHMLFYEKARYDEGFYVAASRPSSGRTEPKTLEQFLYLFMARVIHAEHLEQQQQQQVRGEKLSPALSETELTLCVSQRVSSFLLSLDVGAEREGLISLYVVRQIIKNELEEEYFAVFVSLSRAVRDVINTVISMRGEPPPDLEHGLWECGVSGTATTRGLLVSDEAFAVVDTLLAMERRQQPAVEALRLDLVETISRLLGATRLPLGQRYAVEEPRTVISITTLAETILAGFVRAHEASIRDFTRAFRAVDPRRRGLVSASEIPHLLWKLEAGRFHAPHPGAPPLPSSGHSIHWFLERADPHRTGIVTYSRAVTALREYRQSGDLTA